MLNKKRTLEEVRVFNEYVRGSNLPDYILHDCNFIKEVKMIEKLFSVDVYMFSEKKPHTNTEWRKREAKKEKLQTLWKELYPNTPMPDTTTEETNLILPFGGGKTDFMKHVEFSLKLVGMGGKRIEKILPTLATYFKENYQHKHPTFHGKTF